MKPSSSGERVATYTNFPNNIIEFLLQSTLSKPAIKLYLYYRKKKNNHTAVAYPSFQRIVREAKISNKDLAPARQELVNAGLIEYFPTHRDQTQITFHDDVDPNNPYLVRPPTKNRTRPDSHVGESKRKKKKRKLSSHVGESNGSHVGESNGSHVGESTITNTTTSTTTKGTGKKKDKKKKKVSPSRPTKSSPDAKHSTKTVSSHVGESRKFTTKDLEYRDVRPTKKEYLKAGGSEGGWPLFIIKWEVKHE